MSDFPIFIGGMNRSGTSLMRQLLGSHPEVAIPPTEFGFFEGVGRSRSSLSPAEADDLVARMLAWPKVRGWQLDPDDVRSHVRLESPSYRGVFVGILRAYAEKLGRPRYGEKTTRYERRLSTFDRWFPDGYGFVHLLRHPVATYASTRWYGGDEHRLDPRAWACAWVESVAIGLRALRTRGAQSYVVVRYEDLVDGPRAELERVCVVLDLDYDDRMLEMADFDEIESSSFAATEARYEGLIRRSDNVDRAELVPSEELAIVRNVCRTPAAAFGYDVELAEPVDPRPEHPGVGNSVSVRLTLADQMSRMAAARARRLLCGVHTPGRRN